jgi:hypothetical protein
VSLRTHLNRSLSSLAGELSIATLKGVLFERGALFGSLASFDLRKSFLINKTVPQVRSI